MGIHLVAMGGAVNLTGKALLAFYLASGAAEARIIIIPTASNNPETARKFAGAFLDLGLRRAPVILPLWQRAQAQDDALIMKALLGASSILILGGDLHHLLATLYATRFHKHLREAASNGVIVGGISAGAAALSAIALLPEASNPDPLLSPPRWLPGLGLTEGWILLPHFQQRKRLGLLLSTVLHFAPQAGLGIDEDTAVFIEGDRLRVFGNHWVTVMAVQSPFGRLRAHPSIADIKHVKILRLREGATFALSDLFTLSGIGTHTIPCFTQTRAFTPVASGHSPCR